MKYQDMSKFGCAVTWLSDKFGDIDISSKKKDILQYIKENPNDKKTIIAWASFLKGTQHINEGKFRNKNYNLWKALDIETGTEYKASSTGKLGTLLNISGITIRHAFFCNRLVKKRYKITCEKIKIGVNTGSRKFIWIAENLKTHEVIQADSARELGNIIGTTDSAIIWGRKKNKLVAGCYRISRREKVQ